MRHRVHTFKVGRTGAHRAAMLANMVCSLIEHGQIKTTINRAKETRKMVDALITYGKKGGEHNRRLAIAKLKINTPSDKAQGKNIVMEKLFGELAERYANRPGGYTRILHLGHRIGDGSKFVMIQLVNDAAPAAAEATIEAKAE